MNKNKIYTIWFAKFFAVLASVVATFVPFSFVYAQPGVGVGGSVSLQNPLEVGSFSELISGILQIVIQIGVPIAVLAIIYSGFLFVTAQGNEEKLNTAKSALTWSVVGTAVLLGSWILAGAIGSTIDALSA